jgi:hypothetical protein
MGTKSKPAYLLALGRQPPPPTIELAEGTYHLDRVFKHDFFAATMRYRGADDAVVLKLGRQARLFGLPLSWIGRWHAAHETRMYRALGDLEVVPAFRGRYGKTGFVHAYVPGEPLTRKMPVADDFFDRLRAGLAAMHARGYAYVDLEKCENVVVGDDGKPYLIDFQISWGWPWRWWANRFPVTWLRGVLQRGDLYHLRKLQRRVRPDLLSAAELCASYHKPWYVRWYGHATRPITRVRRAVLHRIDPGKRQGERGRIDPPASTACPDVAATAGTEPPSPADTR